MNSSMCFVSRLNLDNQLLHLVKTASGSDKCQSFII